MYEEFNFKFIRFWHFNVWKNVLICRPVLVKIRREGGNKLKNNSHTKVWFI
jgi:hypothetical protein